MLVLVAALIALGLAVAIIAKAKGGDAAEPQAAPKADCDTCSGGRCELDCMVEAAAKDIEYFDDEELDQYRGRRSGDYTEAEAEQFRDVLLTMRPEEAPAWSRSLSLRGIEMPDQIKDEYILIVNSE